MNKTQSINQDQVLRPTLNFHASPCWALPPSWCSPNPASGSFREALCGICTWEEHTRERKWEVLGRRGHSEAFLHWQCQLGTVPFTVPYLTVYTVPNVKNTVQTGLTVPYRITVHRTVHLPATALIIYGVYTVFLAGKLPKIRPYTVHIYGSGQPY